MSTIKTWIKGFADKDLEAQIALYADTAKWSPPDYNGNVMVGLKGVGDVLSFYHNNFDDSGQFSVRGHGIELKLGDEIIDAVYTIYGDSLLIIKMSEAKMIFGRIAN